ERPDAELWAAGVRSLSAGGDRVGNGRHSFAPVCAYRRPRRTPAPNLVWLAGAVGLDPRPARVPASTLESDLWRDSVMYLEQYEDFWSWALRPGLLTKFMVRGAQIDMHGNANNSVVGADYHRPKVRLPGTAGVGDMGSIGKRLFYWTTTHDPRTLVERVDWVSCAGWLGGGDERERLGLAGGPELVVTNLAVMDFAPGSHRMRIRTVHPGVGVEDVRAATGFELLVADDLGE